VKSESAVPPNSAGSVIHSSETGVPDADPGGNPARELKSQRGQSLDDLADTRPQLVVFLRHAGCTFCREALSDVQQQRAQIEASGCGIVLVHPSVTQADADAMQALINRYSLGDLPCIIDPECRLYQRFGLQRGRLPQLLGLRVLIRGFFTALVSGHGFGRVRSNVRQMPGAYLYFHGKVLNGFQHARASDRPDYAQLACGTDRGRATSDAPPTENRTSADTSSRLK